jgi:tetratricopeptide (TPR) repeat protein
MRIGLIISVLALLFAGCASERPIDRSRSIASEAGSAEMRGDWAASAQLWEQAIVIEKGIWDDPELANSPKLITIYYYELGRSLGVLGQYNEAEKNLLQALRLDQKLNGPKGMDLVELARLNHARGNNIRAASFFDQVIPRTNEISEKDPATYVALLYEAVITYQALGQNDRATELKVKAEKFSANHPNLKPLDNYSWTPYKTISVSN